MTALASPTVPSERAPTPSPLTKAVFTEGSTMRHVVVMTATGSVGLVAIFFVDFISLFYIAQLGRPALTASVGFATNVLFFGVSINVGLMIAVGALVSRALGAGERKEARRLAASSLSWMMIVALSVTIIALPFVPAILRVLGAEGETAAAAARYLWVTLPSNPLMALGMGFSGVLRAVGDARRAMYVTLVGGIVTAFVDPLLIFGLGWGLDGAAVAVVLSRLAFGLVGWWGAVRVHNMVARPRLADLQKDAGKALAIAGPAVLTNIASPVAIAFSTSVLARFGQTAIEASAIIDRLVPLMFGGVFALSGTVGPILGQNWGAGRFDRMRQALRDSLLFATLYVGAAWLLLLLARGLVIDLFGATGLTADLVRFFALASGPTWLFMGFLFTANAAFNNLGFPLLATGFNWGRATLGVIPGMLVGAALAGPQGAVVGFLVGSALFGAAAAVTAFRVVDRLERRAVRPAGGAAG